MRSVLLLSGGVDSLALLADLCDRGKPPLACLTFDYGQRHRREIEAAGHIAREYRVLHHVVAPAPAVCLAGSALTGQRPVPRAHYADPAQEATVVPNRNLAFLSLAAALAVRLGAGEAYFAAHAGDRAVYADCRPEFVEAADRAMRLACGVAVRAPFLGMTKREVVQLARRLRAPLRLAWSCYEGGAAPCGACGACVERAEAEGADATQEGPRDCQEEAALRAADPAAWAKLKVARWRRDHPDEPRDDGELMWELLTAGFITEGVDS